MSADWAQQQAEAKSKKERILGELQSLVRGSSHHYETTNRFKAKSGEFFAAGYAGKADNDRLKARLDELRAAYFAAVEADRRRREAAQDQVKREMQHLLVPDGARRFAGHTLPALGGLAGAVDCFLQRRIPGEGGEIRADGASQQAQGNAARGHRAGSETEGDPEQEEVLVRQICRWRAPPGE